MAGWDRIEVMLQHEFTQLREEGRFIDPALVERAKTLRGDAAIEAFFEELRPLPMDPTYPYAEPDAFAKITAKAIALDPVKAIPFAFFFGALLGRCIGCALGKPLETGPYFWESTKANPGWKNVRRWFEGADAYPIRDYVPAHSRAEKDGLYVVCPDSQKDHIKFMETDDDIRYTLIGLELVERHGSGFTPYQVGKRWHDMLPYQFVCTAETQAYLNFAHVTRHLSWSDDFLHPEDADYVRTHVNPYREWIGAQIRCDGFAYAAAGDPLLAARMAWQDATFSHVKNGVYGEMFFAALISAAFVEKDVDRCLEIALSVIPERSRLYAYLTRTIAVAKASKTQIGLLESVWEYLLDFNCTHTINNACACVASIVFAKGDFSLAVTTAVHFGLDTDCNGATVGSFMGALLGTSKIPPHWTEPLHDTLYAQLPGYHPIAISEVARRFQRAWSKIRFAK